MQKRKKVLIFKYKMRDMKRIKLALAVLAVVVVAIAATYFDYYVWEQQHPNAPFWTYLFKD